MADTRATIHPAELLILLQMNTTHSGLAFTLFHHQCQINETIRESPFIVVPRQNFDHITANLIIGSVLVVLALVFVFIKFPSCKGAPAQQQQLPTESMGPTLKRLFAIPRFRLGILSQFLYVGAQVGVWSFTIRFVQLVQQGTSEHSATYWLLASLVIYAVGKTVATWLMNRLNPAMLLGTFALAATALLLIAVFSGSMLAVYALILVSFCMAPCWPTNFGLVIKGMGKDTQTAGSIVVMSIIGGAVIPLVMGIISDMNGGNMQIAFIAPLLCFVYVAFYGFWCVRKGV